MSNIEPFQENQLCNEKKDMVLHYGVWIQNSHYDALEKEQ